MANKLQSTGGITLDDSGEEALEEQEPVIPEPIRQQMDKTKYYVPSDDDPTTAAVKKAGGVAYQDQTDPGAVAIVNPKADNMHGVLGHEAYHSMVANMPPSEAAKIPQDDYSDTSKTYDISDADKWRAAGATITQIPQEKAARIIERYINGDPATRKQLQPWINDLNKIKQSTVEPNRPGMVDINTAVRPPQGGQQMLENIKPAMPDVSDQWKKLTPQQRDLALSRMSPEQKQKLASSLGFKGEEKSKGLAPRKPEERTFGNYAREGVEGVGRGLRNDVEGLASLRHPIKALDSMIDQGEKAADAGVKEFQDTKGAPIGQRLGAATLTGLEQAPLLGPMVQHAEEGGERMGSPEAFGAAMEGVSTLEAPGAAGKVIGLAPKAAKALGGTGRVTRELVKDTQGENAKIADSNAKQVADRAAEVQKHGADVSAAKKAADERSAAATRKNALDTGVRTLSDKFQADLKETRESEHAKADAKYQTLNKALGTESVPSERLLGHLLDASEKIKGSMTNPTIFKDIEKAVKDGDAVSYDDLQGYYSELGKELSKGTLPGDIYTAYSTLQDAIGQEMQGVADKKGMGPQLADARSSWRNLKQTFYDPRSPLRKAINSTEAGDAIGELAGKDRTGIQALARYNPELAQRANIIRGYADEAKAVKIPGEKAEPKPLAPRKEPTPAKKIGEKEVQSAKSGGLDEKADRIRKMGDYGAIWPAFYSLRTLIHGGVPNLLEAGAEATAIPMLGHGIAGIFDKPSVRDFLTKATAQDVAMIPEELRGDFPRIVDQAKRKGIKVSPILERATQGTAFLAPRKERNATDAWSSPR